MEKYMDTGVYRGLIGITTSMVLLHSLSPCNL